MAEQERQIKRPSPSPVFGSYAEARAWDAEWDYREVMQPKPRGRPTGTGGICLKAHRMRDHEPRYDKDDAAQECYAALYAVSRTEALRRYSDAASKGKRLYCPDCRIK